MDTESIMNNQNDEILKYMRRRMLILWFLASAILILSIVTFDHMDRYIGKVIFYDTKCIMYTQGCTAAPGYQCFNCTIKNTETINDTITIAPSLIFIIACGLFIWSGLYWLCCRSCKNCVYPVI